MTLETDPTIICVAKDTYSNGTFALLREGGFCMCFLMEETNYYFFLSEQLTNILYLCLLLRVSQCSCCNWLYFLMYLIFRPEAV